MYMHLPKKKKTLTFTSENKDTGNQKPGSDDILINSYFLSHKLRRNEARTRQNGLICAICENIGSTNKNISEPAILI